MTMRCTYENEPPAKGMRCKIKGCRRIAVAVELAKCQGQKDWRTPLCRHHLHMRETVRKEA